MLAEFHEALGDKRGRGNAELRITLHQEEHDEMQAELSKLVWHEFAGEPIHSDLRGRLARELADVVYLAYGTAHAFAIDLDIALAEVHRAAMSKLFPPDGGERVVRPDGKVIKPAGFVPPDMSEAIS
jgi:NTP pyrophosphatase (non-canonical NTP hydrolase)